MIFIVTPQLREPLGRQQTAGIGCCHSGVVKSQLCWRQELRMRLTCLFATVLTTLFPYAAFPQTMPSRLSPQALRELGPQWWRWRIALPGIALPDKDAAGHFCDVGQSKTTWYLAGLLSFGSPFKPVRRTCIVPAGRRIFFPVVSNLRITHDDVTCAKAQAEVASSIDHADKLNATLDGVDLLAAGRNRWGSSGTCFSLNLPADGPSSTLTAAADGYWLLIDPLPPGRHTLVYGSSLPSDRDDAARVQTTTYDLEVK